MYLSCGVREEYELVFQEEEYELVFQEISQSIIGVIEDFNERRHMIRKYRKLDAGRKKCIEETLDYFAKEKTKTRKKVWLKMKTSKTHFIRGGLL